jgi:methionine-S-sulfoxide reductase
MKNIYLAGGCFWGLEKYINVMFKVDTEVGYANGHTDDPSYEDICSKSTGHAEVVKVTYDENSLDLIDILKKYAQVIDPISLNKQGNDIGTQYRTGIYYVDEKDDKDIIIKFISELQNDYEQKLMVEVFRLFNYYRAEEYHQKYLEKNPGAYCHIQEYKFKI